MKDTTLKFFTVTLYGFIHRTGIEPKNFVLELFSAKQKNYNRKLGPFKSCLDNDTANSMNTNIKVSAEISKPLLL